MQRPRIILMLLVVAATIAHGGQTPPRGAIDHRIREVDYHPDQVYQITAFFGYHVSVVFAADETVDKLSAGYADAWEVTNYGHYITVQPKERSPATNLVVMTDRRMYNFDLRAKLPRAKTSAASYALDPEQIFALRFRYPADDERANTLAAQQLAAHRAAESSRLARLNGLPVTPHRTQYLFQGESAIAPYAAWDDGTFTYLRFYAEQDLPTPFVVNEDGSESTANKHFDDDVMVIERLAPQFVLRKGLSVVCVFNDNPPLHSEPTDSAAHPRGAERTEH